MSIKILRILRIFVWPWQFYSLRFFPSKTPLKTYFQYLFQAYGTINSYYLKHALFVTWKTVKMLSQKFLFKGKITQPWIFNSQKFQGMQYIKRTRKINSPIGRDNSSFIVHVLLHYLSKNTWSIIVCTFEMEITV